MEFNINESVKVRLTKLGRKIINEDEYAIIPSEDEEGWSEWQLWVLMQTFGPHMGNGMRIPFYTTIWIPDD